MTRAAIAALLAGCNVIYGIESTELQPPQPPARDNDGDGIVNPDDNCVLVANVDQTDVDDDDLGDACDPCKDTPTQTGFDGDGDGVDDGCDSCLDGTNHDEDGDGVGDGCDVCPGSADAEQSDIDGDGVGDACDPDAMTQQRRVFFDGFGPPHPAWNTGFKPWQATADGFAPLTPAVGSSSYNEGPWNPNANMSGGGIRIVASVIVPPPDLLAYTQWVGINIRLVVTGTLVRLCALESNGVDWVRLGDSSDTPVPPGRTRFELAFVPSATVNFSTITCTIAGLSTTSPTLFESNEVYTPSLVSNVAAEFEWIDVLE